MQNSVIYEAVNSYSHGGDGTIKDAHLADVLLQNMELGKYIDNAGEINIHRDKMMAESECGWMGSLGEMYSTLYRFIPRGYRVWASPAELYDAMIYVSVLIR